MVKPKPEGVQAVMQQARGDLLSGNFEKLTQYSEEIERFEQAVLSGGIAKSTLQEVVRDAQRNADLIGAAIRGFKNAQTRLTAMTDVRDNLSLYTEYGDKKKIHTARPALEKKA